MNNKPFLRRWLTAAGLLFASLPVWALSTFDGKPADVTDYTGGGKWLVVMIWASDCHVCNQEASQYVDFQFVHHDDDASVLGISIDGQAKKAEAEKFIARHDVNFPNLIGEPGEVAEWFARITGSAFVGTPTFLFYNPAGKLVAKQVGAVPTEMIEAFMQQQASAKTP